MSTFDEGPMEIATWPGVITPVSPPLSDPTVGPFVCAKIPVPWLAYALGALGQWMQPGWWDVPDDTTRLLVLDWADTLISDIGQSPMCSELGSVSVTILAGNTTASVPVVFPVAFGTTPVVVVSADSPVLIASSNAPTTTGFNAVLTAAVPVLVNTTALVGWIAGPST